VYSIKHGKPNQNLLHENIYLDIKDRKKGWIGIDLSPYNILVSENIIVSLEWISKSAKGKSLTLPIVMPTLSAHFYKYGSQNKWKRFNSMSTYMELQIKSGR
jgi:RIO-like serine/threonine protein kinase